MDIRRISYSNNDGTYTLYNAKRYFFEFTKNRSYEFQYHDAWRVIINNDIVYPLDIHDTLIREGGRPFADILRLADIYNDKVINSFGIDARNLPWDKIIFEAEELLKKEKTEAAFQTGEGFYYNPKDNQDRQIKKKKIHLVQNTSEINLSDLPPMPSNLWKNIWREGDLCCLFADANVGKSALAVQIGCEVAKDKKVLFCDYELSDAIFYSRYTDDKGNLFDFPLNFIRSVALPEVFLSTNPQLVILRDLEEVVKKNGIEVVIIDNISFLGKDCYRPANLSSLIYNLKVLQKKFNLSILILAHTVKRDQNLPITSNDLQGSCRLFNFVDSCFALAKTTNPAGRLYLKQLKARAESIEFGEENVFLLKLTKKQGWLHFDFIGNTSEDECLRRKLDRGNDNLTDVILLLAEKGVSQRQIAAKLRITLSRVHRTLKNLPS